MESVEIGSVCAGRVGVDLVTPDPGGRATVRVELSVWGARYPYKLAAEEARTLARLLEDAAERLTNLPPTSPAPPVAKRPRPKRVRHRPYKEPAKPAELVDGLFALRDGHGHVWTLSAERIVAGLTRVTAQAHGPIEIEGTSYEVSGSCTLDRDGVRARSPVRLQAVTHADGRAEPVPLWVKNRARARLRVLLESETAAAIYSRAVQVGLLPAEKRREVETDTRCQLEERAASQPRSEVAKP